MFDPNPVKSDANLKNHGIAFSRVEEAFVWKSAIEARDVRKPNPEVRTIAIGFIRDRLHVVVFARRGVRVRLISGRKANEKEIVRYVEFRKRHLRRDGARFAEENDA